MHCYLRPPAEPVVAEPVVLDFGYESHNARTRHTESQSYGHVTFDGTITELHMCENLPR